MSTDAELGGEFDRTVPIPPRPRRSGGDAATTSISQIMTRDVVSVPEDMEAEKVLGLMLEQDLSRIPVVTAEGALAGMISRTDFLKYQPLKKGVSVRQIMARSTLRLRESATISQAAELMALQHVHGVPVVSADGRVVGVVTAIDVLGWVAGLV